MHILETTIADKIEHLSGLLEAHWREIDRSWQTDPRGPRPDVPRYRALEAAGMLVSLVAYVGETIVGYSVNVLSPHLHYADLLCAHNDVLFVAEEYRDSGAGLALIRETARACKARGVHLILWSAKQGTPLANILPTMGCKAHETIYSKEL